MLRLLPCTKLPSFTKPPSRIRVPGSTCFAATSLGELKKTMESRNALSISATATASMASPPPISVRRRCLRVIAVGSTAFCASALEPKSFNEVIDLLDRIGMTCERMPRIGGGVFRLVAITQHAIGTNQTQPAVDVAAVNVQPIGKPLHHAPDHLAALRITHIVCSRDVAGARA